MFQLVPQKTAGRRLSRRYTRSFYRGVRSSARDAARAIVPLVVELTAPRSVLDVGCGPAAWLAMFRKHGITDVIGVDGDWVDTRLLDIPAEQFRVLDVSRPFALERRFDLVLCLEVAEHLSPDAAEGLVRSLCAMGPLVLFSAAVPGQGGTRHLNEQWPDYWAELFGQHGFVPVDCIRRRVWSLQEVDFWYAQNTLLFVHEDELERRPALRREYELLGTGQLSVVHPELYYKRVLAQGLRRRIGNAARSMQRRLTRVRAPRPTRD